MKTVMIFGTFDIVHHGHIHFFQQARKYGDHLIVVVARDTRAEDLKKKKLVYTEKERKYFLEQIKLIDTVILGGKQDVYAVIKKMKPNTIVLGYDQAHFTDALHDKIQEFKLKTKIIRAKPYKQEKLKSQKIRELLEKKI